MRAWPRRHDTSCWGAWLGVVPKPKTWCRSKLVLEAWCGSGWSLTGRHSRAEGAANNDLTYIFFVTHSKARNIQLVDTNVVLSFIYFFGLAPTKKNIQKTGTNIASNVDLMPAYTFFHVILCFRRSRTRSSIKQISYMSIAHYWIWKNISRLKMKTIIMQNKRIIKLLIFTLMPERSYTTVRLRSHRLPGVTANA